MFKVTDKNTKKVYTVYSVRWVKEMGTLFLIWNKESETWQWNCSDRYEPHISIE